MWSTSINFSLIPSNPRPSIDIFNLEGLKCSLLLSGNSDRRERFHLLRELSKQIGIYNGFPSFYMA